MPRKRPLVRGKLAVELLPLSDLANRTARRNPKRHDIDELETSLVRFGYTQPVLIDDTSGHIVAGHGRVEALLSLRANGGRAPDRVEVRDGEWHVPVIRGVHFRNEDEAHAYLLADNRLVETGGYDDRELLEMLRDLESREIDVPGFDDADLDDLARAVAELDAISLAALDLPEPEPERHSVSFEASASDEDDEDDERMSGTGIAPPFSYYGGKQRLISRLLPLVPKHTVFVEPFCGGGTMFFRKPFPAITASHDYREVINDRDRRVVGFFEQLRDNPEELMRVIAATPYAREEHALARVDTPENPIESARRWYTSLMQSFSNSASNGWGTAVFGGNPSATWQSRFGDLWPAAERLRGVYLECDDALKLIERWDSPQTFFYCDPPYPGTEQGHYSGYTTAEFVKLIRLLERCDGSSMVSCYPIDGLECDDRWERFEFTTHASSSARGRVGPGRNKSRKSTEAELGDKTRTEVVLRRFGVEPREEIRKLYESGKFDCYPGYPGQSGRSQSG